MAVGIGKGERHKVFVCVCIRIAGHTVVTDTVLIFKPLLSGRCPVAPPRSQMYMYGPAPV